MVSLSNHGGQTICIILRQVQDDTLVVESLGVPRILKTQDDNT